MEQTWAVENHRSVQLCKSAPNSLEAMLRRADATLYSAKDQGRSRTLEAAAEKGPQLFDAFVAWTIVERLRVRAGQFKAPFGYRFNVPDLVDELPMAPVSLQAATPGRQAGGEISYDFWRFAQLSAGAFSGVGQNRAANNTRVAFAGKLQVQPLVSSRRLPQIVANLSIFTYHKTHGFTPDVHTPLGLVFYHGVPANGGSYRLTAGGGVFWRFLSVRAEYFRTRDARERDDDGDPTTPGVHLPPMIGQGMYVQAGVVVTGQRKRIDDLLPEVEGYRVRASAVELSIQGIGATLRTPVGEVQLRSPLSGRDRDQNRGDAGQRPRGSSTRPSHTCAASIATFWLMNACWVPV